MTLNPFEELRELAHTVIRSAARTSDKVIRVECPTLEAGTFLTYFVAYCKNCYIRLFGKVYYVSGLLYQSDRSGYVVWLELSEALIHTKGTINADGSERIEVHLV